MTRALVAFFVLFILFYFSITAARMLTGKETWELTKALAYSLFCAIVASLVLLGIVFVF